MLADKHRQCMIADNHIKGDVVGMDMVCKGACEKKKVAVVHDWLVTFGGAERALASILACFPEADVFTMVDFLPKEDRGFLSGHRVQTSALQRFPWAKKRYRAYLPFMPFLVEQFDLSEYNLVISSSHAVAKGVLTGPDQLHISYIYTPMRYAWDMQSKYLRDQGRGKGSLGLLRRYLLYRLRFWDARSANGVDHMIAISHYIARRIAKIHSRSATVLYPPVDVAAFKVSYEKKSFYVTASRLVPYKRIDLIIDAFAQMPDRELVVIGDGPEFHSLKRDLPANVQLLGFLSHKRLQTYLQQAQAFIFAAEEDFGIAPLEAQACGTPVIALAKGGARETICGEGGQRSGVFFYRQTAQALIAAVHEFEQKSISPDQCRENAMRFSKQRFEAAFSEFIDQRLQAFEADISS